MRLFFAFKMFFRILFSAETARQTRAALEAPPQPKTQAATPAAESQPAPAAKAKPKKQEAPARSEAITLLAALQREARLVDLIQESLDEYSNEQVGAAARDVLRDSKVVLERLLGVAPLLAEEEGAAIEVPAGYDPGRFQLTGKVGGEPPHAGQLVHPGWIATKCDLPKWSGSNESRNVIAPAEVELS